MEFDYVGDKSWMYVSLAHRMKMKFQKGMDAFLDFAFKHMPEGVTQIVCPCINCQNARYHTRNNVEFHIGRNGFAKGYDVWIYHGEFDDRSKGKGKENDNAIFFEGGDMEAMTKDATGGPDHLRKACHSENNYKQIERKGADTCTPWDLWLCTHTVIDPEAGEATCPNESTRRSSDKARAEIQTQCLELSSGSDLSLSCGHRGGYGRGIGQGPTTKKLKSINKETLLERELKEDNSKLQAEVKLLKEQREDPTPGTTLSAGSIVQQVLLQLIIRRFGNDGLDALYDDAIRARDAKKEQVGPSDSRQYDDNE